MACPIRKPDGSLDEEALDAFVKVGGHLFEGLPNTPDRYQIWSDALKQSIPGFPLNEGDIATIRQNIKATQERRTGVTQTVHPHEAFLSALSKKVGSDKKAAELLNDLVGPNGDTTIIDKLLKGKPLTPAEEAVFNKAYGTHKRGAPGPAKPGGVLEEVNQIIAKHNAEKQKAKTSGVDTRTDVDKLTDSFAGSLGTKGAKEWRAKVGDDVLGKLSRGEELTPQEWQSVTSEYDRVQKSKPGPGSKAQPLGHDAVMAQMTDFRKEANRQAREAAQNAKTSSDTLEDYVARSLNSTGADQWRAAVGETVLGKIARNEKLTPQEFNSTVKAYQDVLQGKPPKGINLPPAAVREARQTIAEAATEARKAIENDKAAKAFADAQSAKRHVRDQMAKQFKTAEDFNEFENRLGKVADNPEAIRRFYQKELFDAKTRAQQLGQRVQQVIQLSNTLKTTFDLSYVGRQGGILTAANPELAVRSGSGTLKALLSDANAEAVHESILQRPNARLYKESGLHLSDIGSEDITKAEENYASNLATQIPGLGHLVKSSERANVTYLNLIRANTFDSMAELTKKLNGGKLSEADAKSIANYVNVATGRGTVDALPRELQGLMQVMFSPKLVTSRFEYALGGPLAARWEKGAGPKVAMSSKGVAGAMATQYVRYYGMVVATLAIAKTIKGVKVETDPRSSNFGKIQIGDKTFDMMSGLAQTMVLMSREWNGRTKAQDGTVKPLDGKGFNGTRGDVLGRFFRSKLRPDIGTGWDAFTGKDYLGKPFDAIGTPGNYFTDGAALKTILPLSLPDIVTAAKQDGMSQAAITAMVDGLGISTNVKEPTHSKSGSLGSGLSGGLSSGISSKL